jgi:hypothetical protein
MKQQQQQKTNDVLNSCARCCGQEEQWTPQALPVGGNRSRRTLSAPSGPFQTKSNTAHIASALPQMHRSDKRANFGSCKIKKWASQRGPRRFVFCRLCPSSSPFSHHGSTWLLHVIFLLLTNSLSPVRVCLYIWEPKRIQSSLVQAVKHCINSAMI